VTDDDRDLRAVVELERLLLRPDVRADRERVERLLHPEFEELGASGRVRDRASVVDAVVAHPAGWRLRFHQGTPVPR
jgi:ribonuclease HI